MQYYRYDRSLDPDELIKERLGIRGASETTGTTTTTTTTETFEGSNGGVY